MRSSQVFCEGVQRTLEPPKQASKQASVPHEFDFHMCFVLVLALFPKGGPSDYDDIVSPCDGRLAEVHLAVAMTAVR